MRKIDLTNSLAGTLQVTGPAPDRKRKPHWKTICTICHRSSVRRADTLTGANPTARCRCQDARVLHGGAGRLARDPLYNLLTNIKGRVARQSYGYEIEMEADWRPRGTGFAAFRDYINGSIGPRPTKRHSLDRIDVLDGYVRGNLRWADDVTQADNRTSTKLYKSPEYELELTAREWSNLLNQITGQSRWTRADVQVFLDRLHLTPAQMIAAVRPPLPDPKHESGKQVLRQMIARFDRQGWWAEDAD